jgi:glycosyltransferase involved in cell wall biosynthesis
MRILHVIPTYLPAYRYGGPIMAVHGLCRELVSRGHRVEVLTTSINGPADSAVPIGVPVAVDGVQVRYFSSRLLRRLSWAPALALALRREIDEFDIVHLHSVFLWPTWAAARSSRRAHVPYLVSPRGMLVKELVRRRNRFVKSAWMAMFERTNIERASAIHVTSQLEAAELAQFNWNLPEVAMIPNGVDDPEAPVRDAISADVREVSERQPLVLFLGRLSWKKGLDRLLKAFALTDRGTLAIAGTDDEGVLPQLSQLADGLKISDRVQFIPRTILGHDREYLFSAAKLFVLSSYSENFGNTVLEAMRRSVPVVVTPEVGAAEVVRRANGGIVTPGDPETLASAIGELIADPARARSLGESGRLHVQEQYAWFSVAAQMEALYDKLAA